MKNLYTIKKKFLAIKKLGFVENKRPNNKDGGLGNTLEDLLGIVENNLKTPDFKNFEIKSQRELTNSLLSLFSKSPSHPRQANTYIRTQFGVVRDTNFPNNNKFYATINAKRESIIYEKYKIKVDVDTKNQKIYFVIKDLKNVQLNEEIYWNFEDLEKASKKLKSLMFVGIEEDKSVNPNKIHFKSAKIYDDFCFDKFVDSLEKGYIFIDFRIGVYNSGSKIGKTHDHGTGFRISPNNLNLIYNNIIEI